MPYGRSPRTDAGRLLVVLQHAAAAGCAWQRHQPRCVLCGWWAVHGRGSHGLHASWLTAALRARCMFMCMHRGGARACCAAPSPPPTPKKQGMLASPMHPRCRTVMLHGSDQDAVPWWVWLAPASARAAAAAVPDYSLHSYSTALVGREECACACMRYGTARHGTVHDGQAGRVGNGAKQGCGGCPCPAPTPCTPRLVHSVRH